ncbi:sensor histidine kinase [Xylanimonas allomyrinae]|uniref:histidine kinase n=1 Tax=Xylanimonas allomyrinae TaxID=2509459 RepID=A0A4P6ESI1_9MICO|nr:sensor histidine kinase [Xylanimonas allomyrinae]
MPVGDAVATDGPRDPWAWDRIVLWWDVAAYAVLALTVLSLLLAGSRGRALAVQLVCVAVIALAYALVGARAARTRDRARALAYLAVVVVATTGAVTQGDVAVSLLFMAFAHAWMLTDSLRDGIVVVTALVVGTTLGIWGSAGWEDAALAQAAPQMGVTFVFVVALGLWVAFTMRQSEENARLVDRLRAAQAELAATQHAAGVVAERERLAREIHDTLAQGFTSVVMQAQAAGAALDRGDDGSVRERLATMETTARDNLAEARGLVAAFAPVPLQGATLTDALRRLAGRWAAETGARATVSADDVGALEPAEEVVLLRAAQEALANVRRHAGAASVRVTLRGGGGRPVELDVIDDGRGIDDDVAEGFGLRGMRERVTAGGGSLDVGPREDGGTAVHVRLPARSAS